MNNLINYTDFSFKEYKDNILATSHTLKSKGYFIKANTINKVDKEELKARSYIVKKYIKEILKKANSELIEIDVKNINIINYWEEYIKDFAEDSYLNEKTKDSELLKILEEKTKLFTDILIDNKNKNFLLIDENISPEKLSFRDIDVIKSYKNLFNNIKKENKDELFSVGIVNPGQGVFLDYLLSEVKTIGKVDLIGSTILTLTELEKKHKNIHFTKWDINKDFISGDHIGKFDYLFIPNTVHHFDDIEKVVKTLNLTLKKAGKLYITDFISIDPMSILVSIFFQEKNINEDNEKRKGVFYKVSYIEELISSLPKENSSSYISCRGNMFEACVTNKNNYKTLLNQALSKHKSTEKNVIIVFNKEDISLNKIEEKSSDEININQEKDNESFIQETDILEKLTELWENNLGSKGNVHKESNYFKLGGDSLSATKLTVSIRNELNCEISLAEIFSNPKLRDMLQLLEEKSRGSEIIIEGEI